MITCIGVPSDAGAGKRGCVMGPGALRAAGIFERLLKAGIEVQDRGDLSGPMILPPYPDLPVNALKYPDQVNSWVEGLYAQSLAILNQNNIPLVLGGDHSLAIGSVQASSTYASQRARPLHLIWVDAHADFNTPDTSATGNIHGMPVSVITGASFPPFRMVAPPVPYDQISMVGIRSVDALEKPLLRSKPVHVYDMEDIDQRSMSAITKDIVTRAVDANAMIHVSFDIDALDPMIAPGVGTPVMGGLTARDLRVLFQGLASTKQVIAADIFEMNPAFDHTNQTANLVADLMPYLFGAKLW